MDNLESLMQVLSKQTLSKDYASAIELLKKEIRWLECNYNKTQIMRDTYIRSKIVESKD